MKIKKPECLYNAHDFFIKWRNVLGLFHYPVRGTDNGRQPFFIVGSGRSGNTLLRRILLAHPDVYIPPETYVLPEVIRLYKRHSGHSWQDLVYLVVSRFEYHPEFETFDMSMRPIVYNLLQLSEKDRNLANMLSLIYQFMAEQKKGECRLWGDKTPTNTFGLDRISSVFPQAKYVHIVRDGCDVISSYLEAGIYDNVELASYRWLESVQLAKTFLQKDGIEGFVIKYEDLVRTPEKVIKGLCGFLEIKYLNAMLDSEKLAKNMGDVGALSHHDAVSKKITSDSIGKGRKKLSKEQMIMAYEIINDELEAQGYSPCIF